MVEFWTKKGEIGDKDEDDMENTSGYEKSRVRLARLGLEDVISVLLLAISELVPAVSGILN
jgi:hypothetical protein